MRIAVFSDLHYSDHPNAGHPRRRGEIVPEILERVVDRLNGEFHPDLVICAGDLVDDPKRSDLLPEVVRHLKRLRAPFLAIPGNHDPLSEEFYCHVPRPPVVLDLDGIRFLPFTDDPERPGWNAARTPEELDRMIRSASAFPGPSVSIQHVPLYRPGVGMARYHYEYAETILDAMRDSGVRLSISGHDHQGMRPVSDGRVTALAAPALCEEPFPFLLFELDRNGLLSDFRTIEGAAR